MPTPITGRPVDTYGATSAKIALSRDFPATEHFKIHHKSPSIPFTQTQGDHHGKEATGKIQHRTDDCSNLYRLDIAGSLATHA